MSGAPTKGKRRDPVTAQPDSIPFGGAPKPVTVAEEPRPPQPARTVVRCKDCFWGQDVSAGFRRCRGSTPTPLYRVVTGYGGAIGADPMWARVADDDYCARGELKP